MTTDPWIAAGWLPMHGTWTGRRHVVNNRIVDVVRTKAWRTPNEDGVHRPTYKTIKVIAAYGPPHDSKIIERPAATNPATGSGNLPG